MSVPVTVRAAALALALAFVFGACREGDASEVARRRLVVLERIPELARVADEVDARLPGPEVAFSSTVAVALARYELAQIRRTKDPDQNGVVKTDPVTAVFPGGVPEVERFFAHLSRVRRPWVFDALERTDDTVRIEITGFALSTGNLERSASGSEAQHRRIDEALARLAKDGYDAERIQRLERVAMKQSILGDIDERAHHSQGDLHILLGSAVASSILPKRMTLSRTSGKKRGTLEFESSERRVRFVGEASRRGAVHADDELILPSGTVVRISGG